MNSKDARYVQDVVNGTSQLVEVERVAALGGLGAGTSLSGTWPRRVLVTWPH